MNEIISRIDKVLHQLASQQAIPDDFWRPEWESIKEALATREWERRQQTDRRNVTTLARNNYQPHTLLVHDAAIERCPKCYALRASDNGQCECPSPLRSA